MSMVFGQHADTLNKKHRPEHLRIGANLYCTGKPVNWRTQMSIGALNADDHKHLIERMVTCKKCLAKWEKENQS